MTSTDLARLNLSLARAMTAAQGLRDDRALSRHERRLAEEAMDALTRLERALWFRTLAVRHTVTPAEAVLDPRD